MPTPLNPQSPIPLYRQLAEQLTAGIRAGQFLPGSRIPSEHQLAATYAIGRPTARQAVDLLVRKGLLVRRRGSGTYVCEPQQEVDLFSLDGTRASFHKKGLAMTTRILEPLRLQTVKADPDNPFSGAAAFFFTRLSLVGGTPVLLEALYLHATLFAGIDQINLQGRSLSVIAEEQFYLRPTGAKQCFSIGYLSGDDARHLQVAPDTPVLKVTRALDFPQTAHGVFSQLWCRTDQFVFSQTIGGTLDA